MQSADVTNVVLFEHSQRISNRRSPTRDDDHNANTFPSASSTACRVPPGHSTRRRSCRRSQTRDVSVHRPGSVSFFGAYLRVLYWTSSPKNVPDPLSLRRKHVCPVNGYDDRLSAWNVSLFISSICFRDR